MPNDTITLRIHATYDQKPVVIDELEKIEHPTDLEFVCPSHFELFKKMLDVDGKYSFLDMKLFLSQENENDENFNDDEFLLNEFSSNKKHFLKTELIQYVSEKEVIQRYRHGIGKMRLTSQNSDVVFKLNFEAGFIDFEFSVPKYLYSHNIAQFIPQRGSKAYGVLSNRPKLQTLEYQLKIAYPRLISVIDVFLQDLFDFFNLEFPIDKKYLELIRIDFCYNQYFENKESALQYLSNQKKIKNTRNRKSTQSNKPYDTSIEFHSFGMYGKVYHKGSEYSSKDGDKKKHIKHNSNFIHRLLKQQSEDLNNEFSQYKFYIEKYFLSFDNNISNIVKLSKKRELEAQRAEKFLDFYLKNRIFDIVHLQNESDKILRYEVTFRPKYMSYRFKTKYFRLSDKPHLAYKNIHDKVRGIYDARNSSNTLIKVDKVDRLIFEDYKKWQERNVSFVFSNDTSLKEFQNTSYSKKHKIFDYKYVLSDYTISKGHTYKHSLLASKDVAPFDDVIYQMLSESFLDFFKMLQVKELKEKNEIIDQIKEYNSLAKQRAETYNKTFSHLCLNIDGTRKVKGRNIITKATQLLTQKELRDKGLKSINVNNLILLVSHIEDGYNLDQIRDELKLTSSTFHRYCKDLETFNITRQSQKIQNVIKPYKGFEYYYKHTTDVFNVDRFFIQKEHLKYA